MTDIAERAVVGRITKLERLNNSASGNPVWRIRTDELIPLFTAHDAQIAYDIQQFVKRRVRFTVNDMGRVVQIELA